MGFSRKNPYPPVEDIPFLSHRPPGYPQIFSDPPGYPLIFLYTAPTPWISADIFKHPPGYPRIFFIPILPWISDILNRGYFRTFSGKAK